MKTLIFTFLLALSGVVWAETGTLVADGDTAIVGPLTRPSVLVSGQFGSVTPGTFTVYIKDDNGEWTAVPGAAFVSADGVVLDYDRPVMVKGTLDDSSGTVALKWTIR